jgi:hypothetical protein
MKEVIGQTILIFGTWFMIIFLAYQIDILNERIDDLENQSKEVHEYILNRIGG